MALGLSKKIIAGEIQTDPLPTAGDPSRYQKVGEYRINGYFKFVDPFRPRILCDGYGAAPFWSGPFVFDLRTRRSLPCSVGVKLFLKPDWLGPRLAQAR